MSLHLSEQQTAAYLAGQRSEETEQHLAQCSACRAEVQAFQQTLAAFRGSVHEWSSDQFTSERVGRPVPASWSVLAGAWRWTLLAVVACVLLLVRLPDWNRQPAPVPVVQNDNVLLQQIDLQLASSAPQSMEPLTQLVSWEEEPATDSSRVGSMKEGNSRVSGN